MKPFSSLDTEALLGSGLSLSRILLYTAESWPLILTRRAMGVFQSPNPGPPKNNRQILRAEVFGMLKEDFVNLSRRLYSLDVKPPSPIEHAKRYLRLFQDSIDAASRAKKRQYKKFSEEAKERLSDMPEYYARNFHFQTDGYLSEHSADLYEHQTEILFMGTLGLMRRLLLAPLISMAKRKPKGFRILEIGAGTGEATQILARALPNAFIEAIDLSEPYLAKAEKRLAGAANVTFTQADGTSYKSKTKFDAVVSAYCLHEMPEHVRRQIIKNAAANLKKGGYLLLIDSLQLSERHEFDWALKQFPKDFHEPFYANYVKTPLHTLLSEDLQLVEEKSRFLSKSLLAKKI